MIFTYVFSGEEYLLRRHDYSTLICGEAVTDINMSLLLVSRQAYSETALLPYKLGTICFRFNPSYISWQADIEIFLEERSAEQIEAIACLEVCETDWEGPESRRMQTGVCWARELGVW